MAELLGSKICTYRGTRLMRPVETVNEFIGDMEASGALIDIK